MSGAPAAALSLPTQRRPTPIATTAAVTFRAVVHEELKGLGVILWSVLGGRHRETFCASQPLLVTRCLPFLDGVYRVDQHHDVQREVVPDQDR